uniref:Repressor LexA n=1 Tax=candidate division WOR-3 bacterium TaxID=2052148 RepID=A0A7V3V047_UNCW3
MKKNADIKEKVACIQQFYQEQRRMPSYAEIARLFNWRSKNAVFRLVAKLKALNLVDQDPTGRLIPKSVIRPLKLLGTVEAGFPSPAEEELLGKISLDEYLVQNSSSTFLLKVTGDSMQGAGILPGDLVLIDRALIPKNGDIVIAEVDGEWTIKYFHKQGTRITLIPANPKYQPVKPKQELKIGGVVTAVIRKYR